MLILAEAEETVASKEKQLVGINEEINALGREMRFYQRFSRPESEGADGREEPALKGRDLKSDGFYNGTDSPSTYIIKLATFVNARHFVSFGKKTGPVHAHSWQIQIDVQVPGKSELVGFAKVLDAVKSVFIPYEESLLNKLYPFNKVQPTTENMALFFFNRLDDILKSMDLSLGRLSVWETPTKGIEVNCRFAGFEGLDGNGMQEDDPPEALQQVAVTTVSGDAQDYPFRNIQEEACAAPAPDLEKTAAVTGFRQSAGRYLLAVLIISLAAIISYGNVLWPPAEQHYPWGSDTWGHLFKAEYLYHEILKGNYYPDFSQFWYNGGQPFRYWAPLPYYLLALMRWFTGDIYYAGIYFVFVCALFGGLSWILYSGRMGLAPSILAGVVWSVWQDNVRVAFSEGNLPRVLATALLPLLFIIFLKALENRKSYLNLLSVVVLIHLVILCHAMIAAIYCLCLLMFTFLLWVFGGCRPGDCQRGLLALAAGVASASWWLLPSLTGGITSLDAEAVRSAIQFVPAEISFNPITRFANRETFYWGISLLPAIAVTLPAWPSKPPWAKSLVICGLVLMLITFPAFQVFYTNMPMSNLLWPLRFSSFAALALLASCLVFNPPEGRQRLLKSTYVTGFLIAGIFAALLLDCLLSVRTLVYTGPRSSSLMEIAGMLEDRRGWRVATLDLSRLGSAPSFIFSNTAGLEQVFGWAWQGAVTSSSIMLLNTGLEKEYYPFLFRSCINLGATELVVDDEVIKGKDAFSKAAGIAGYKYLGGEAGISLWHSKDGPYLVEKKNKCLVVGKQGEILSMLFPGVEIGYSAYIDDYPLEYLKKFPQVIFSGSEWRSKSRAAEAVTRYAEAGGKVFIELAGMPQNVLSKQPEFLGVAGETVTLRGQLEILGGDKKYLLQPFSPEIPLWKSYIPLGLDEIAMEFMYYGNRAPVYGYKVVNGHRINFLGANISYHAYLTGDPVALKIIKDILNLSMNYEAQQTVPLTEYRITENGYVLGYNSDHGFEAIVPIAAMDGMTVRVDGTPWETGKYENLLQMSLPSGSHTIVIALTKGPDYRWGTALSVGSVAMLFISLIYFGRRDGPDR
ncbi:MAG: hypothetical protein VR68_03130 [Peptococcaceae bacterium BRH_c4a]|nr:MAG: hypothetical protein VR68_03130 [Peptococcaceae bacterium BRH_c4a]